MPARGGAEVPLGLYYKIFLIYRPCLRRAPARPVRACFVRTRCTVVVQANDLRATPAQCNAKRTPSSHFTLRSSHPALSHFTLQLISNHVSSSHLISPHLSSSHLIPSVLTCHPNKFSQLFSSHTSTDQPFSSPRSSS